MSGGTEVIAGIAAGIGSLVMFGAYAVYKAGELMVKGTAGLVKVSAKGAKALAGALAQQQRKLAEEAEQKRIEREKKREDARLEALGRQKMIAEERIGIIINDSNESADKIARIAADARAEAAEVADIYSLVAGGSGFDCTGAQEKLDDIVRRISAVLARLADDDTEEVLGKTIEDIRNAGESAQVREYLKSLHGNAELAAELQVALASARMECAALRKAALALKDLHADLLALSVELSASSAVALEKINALVRSTDAADYDSIMQTYRAANELIAEMKRTADASKNVRLSAFLSSRLAVIQSRLDAIVGERKIQAEADGGAEFSALLARAEDAYAVLSDGRLNYMSGTFAEKIRAARISARAKNNLEGLRRTVKNLEAEAEVYEALCEEHGRYTALKAECDELAAALGYGEESDNFSADKALLAREIARLNELKEKYAAELAARRRSTLIARSALAFASDEYDFLGEYEFGDEEGTVQLLYARKGEAGAIHVVQADLNGYVSTYTTGVNILKDGKSLITAGSDHVKKACAEMREKHRRTTREFDEMLGVDYAMTSVLDLPPEDPAALELPCIPLEGKRLEEYLLAVGATVYTENGELKLADTSSADGGAGKEVTVGEGIGNRSAGGASAAGVLHADTDKK